MKYKPDKNICYYHNEIINIAKDLQRLRNFDNIDEVISYVENWASQIEENANYALEAGQNMENRLSDYRSSIESLGFKRDYPTK